MGFYNNLRYRLRMLTNTEIAAAGMGVPGLFGMGPMIGSSSLIEIRWPEFDTNRVEAVPILGRGHPISGQLTLRSGKCHITKSLYFQQVP